MSGVAQEYLDASRRWLAPSTRRVLTSRVRVFLRFLRSERPRGRLTPELLNASLLGRFHDHLTRERGNTPIVAHQVVRAVEAFWRWAWEHDEHGEWFGRPKRLQLAEPAPVEPARVPAFAELDRVIAAVTGEGSTDAGGVQRAAWYRQVMVIARYTGLRVGQVLRLEWRDVDLDAALLTVRPELGKSKQEKRGRVVPIAEHLVEELAGWGRREGYLVEPWGGRRVVDYKTLERIYERAGVDYPRQPMHGFRKALVSWLTEQRVRQLVISRLVGHAAGITADVYTDPAALLLEQREAVATIPKIGQADGRLVELDRARAR